MNRYLVYITTGGVMEQPFYKKEKIEIIEAENPDEAIEKWLKINNLSDESYIRRGENGKGWSYYYSITCETIETNINDDIRSFVVLFKNEDSLIVDVLEDVNRLNNPDCDTILRYWIYENYGEVEYEYFEIDNLNRIKI